MFNGFSKEAFDFLFGIRMNNNREWFEPRKKIYTGEVYEPLKELAEQIYKPFEKTGMIHKAGRIYRDESFPPYLHYRDTLYIYVRYQAYYWNRTPTLYFEISPEGGEFGFRISKPEAAVMESFRKTISDDPSEFLALVKKLKRNGISFGGDEYKRKKPCTVPDAEEFFVKKGLSAYRKITDISEMNRPGLADDIIKAFRLVMPLNEMFHEIVTGVEAEKALEKVKSLEADDSPDFVEAPKVDFMF